MTAKELRYTQQGIIIGFSDENIAKKLLSMGFMLGNQITIIRKAPLGNVFYAKIDGINIALRDNEMKGIEVV
jgi:Fe2+ transport system protein FeoA